MNPSADVARLTIQLREPTSGGYEAVAAEVVQRAHAAGMWSATIRRGSAASARTPAIPAPRSLSLADEEGFTIVIAGVEEQFAALVHQLHDVIGDTAIVRIECGEQVRELTKYDGPALSR